jgi:predicted PurR-regulated permease PerM
MYTVNFEDGSEFEIAEEFLAKCESSMKLNFKAGLLFAAFGFAIVVAIGLLYLDFNVIPLTALLCLAPATIVYATEDPGWTELLLFVAPLNAALYGGTAFVVTSVLRYFLERHRAASSAR